MIDRNIQEHIRILNEKRYKTCYCCEGHYDPICASIYISFANDYKVNENSIIPDGFRLSNKNRTLTYTFKRRISEEEFQTIKEQKLKELLEWSKNLPMWEGLF
jgi:hypothetical protein